MVLSVRLQIVQFYSVTLKLSQKFSLIPLIWWLNCSDNCLPTDARFKCFRSEKNLHDNFCRAAWISVNKQITSSGHHCIGIKCTLRSATEKQWAPSYRYTWLKKKSKRKTDCQPINLGVYMWLGLQMNFFLNLLHFQTSCFVWQLKKMQRISTSWFLTASDLK